MHSTLLIAIAEDHSSVREAFISMINLQSPNSNIFAVGSNGKELLEKIKQSNKIPDIVILDLSMPIMDGSATANLSLNEIAIELCVAPKTVENYRDTVYQKLHVHSRHELIIQLKAMGFNA